MKTLAVLLGFTIWFNSESGKGFVYVNDAAGDAVIVVNPGNTCSVTTAKGREIYKCTDLAERTRISAGDVVGVIAPAKVGLEQ